jgi:hypothetical protein
VAPIPEQPALRETRRVAHVQIAYHRPAGLSDDDLRSWLVVRAGSLMSLRLEPAGAQTDHGVVHVTVEVPRQPGRGRDAIGGLLGDMRMLGLRPTIVSSP